MENTISILLIDEDAKLCQDLINKLQQLGIRNFGVHQLHHPNELEGNIKEYDLILSNVFFKKKKDFSALHRLYEANASAHLVAFASRSDQKTVHMCFVNGAVMYFYKPVMAKDELALAQFVVDELQLTISNAPTIDAPKTQPYCNEPPGNHGGSANAHDGQESSLEYYNRMNGMHGTFPG